MKRQIKYRIMMIPKKLSVELRLTVDTSRNPRFSANGETTTEINGDTFTSLTMFPLISLSILRPAEIDENGLRQRAPFNPSDNLGMTRYQFPIFVSELERANANLKVPELYRYLDQRLTLNEELAEQYRQVFVIGNIAVELVPVVITQPDETKVEGIRMKFNNETSTVPLTLNDIESLLFTLKGIDIDNIVLFIHATYMRGITSPEPNAINGQLGSVIDIKPKGPIPIIGG